MDSYYIISGGPGAGKTTLIAALAAAGFATAGESGRAILAHQQAIDGPAQHTRDAALYAELMLARDMENHGALRGAAGPVFFDRGVPELVGYLEMMGHPAPPHFERAAARYRYNDTVFLAPPWPAIYAHDDLRKQSLGEAQRSYDVAAAIYPRFGYRTVELPRAGVGERVAFVQAVIGLP
ncbi:MAG: AAA family ATPase [Alphaproteobacteria bacterium]|nr:AAA family ATPase [Alphaproteobacteria bacterium]